MGLLFPGQGQRSAPQQTTQGELHAQVSGVPKPCTRGVSSAPLVVLGACYPFWGPQRRGGHAETGRGSGGSPRGATLAARPCLTSRRCRPHSNDQAWPGPAPRKRGLRRIKESRSGRDLGAGAANGRGRETSGATNHEAEAVSGRGRRPARSGLQSPPVAARGKPRVAPPRGGRRARAFPAFLAAPAYPGSDLSAPRVRVPGRRGFGLLYCGGLLALGQATGQLL